LETGGQWAAGNFGLDGGKVGFIGFAKVPGDADNEWRDVVAGGQPLAGFDQDVQALVFTDAGEVTDDGLLLRRLFGARSVAAQPETVGDDVDPRAVDAEVVGHEASVVIVERDERVNVGGALSQDRTGLIVIRVRQFLEEDVLAR
jgi:hypothetical protein